MNTYYITGMNCSACSSHIEQLVRKIPGVTSCEVSLVTGSMVVEGNVSSEIIISAVTELGYGISSSKDNGNRDFLRKLTPDLRSSVLKFLFSLVLLALLAYIATGHLMFNLPLGSVLAGSPDRIAYAELILASVIILINGDIILRGYRGLVRMMPTMDTLVAIGVSAAYLYSANRIALLNTLLSLGMHNEASQILPGLFFESSAMLIVIVTFGKILEKKAQGNTTNALKKLLKIIPKTAHRLDAMDVRPSSSPAANQRTEDINADELQVNDIFVVLPGEYIPADAVILEGVSSVNESGITGESMPREVAEGDSVTGATINIDGLIKCRTVRTGADTVFGQMIQTVKDALTTKAPIARVADRVAAWFVHGVIILALVTFAVWYFVLNKSLAEALEYAVAVLLVSCPCALGLATPMAVTVGSGKALDNGILFKEASAIETIGRIKYAAMDKTGTVTAGTPEVTSVTSVSDISTKHILHLAGILECFSNHPLAGAITAKSGIKTPDTYGLMDEEMTDIIRTVFMEQSSSGILSIRDFSEVSSGGVQALINNHRVYLGKLDFIKEKVVVSPEVSATCGDMARKGETVLLLATASKVLGIITVNDTVRPNAAEAVAVLYRDGIIPVMLTGDNLYSAIGVAERVNIKNVRSDCLPTTKATIIRDLKARGMTAMVGDGINDALPLTEADVGIAVGSGSEIARDAGSVVLVNSDPLSLIKAIRCGRLTLKVIHQNLFWALCYNIIGIPLAAGALSALDMRLTPVFAAICMALSSLIVVGNSLRIYFADLSNAALLKEGSLELTKIQTMGEEYFRKLEKSADSEGLLHKTTHPASNPDEPIFDGFMGIDGNVSDDNAHKTANGEKAPTRIANLIIDGMVCEHCESTVCNIIKAHVTTVNIVISHKKNAAIVEYKGILNEALLKHELSVAGYNLIKVFDDSEKTT